MLGSVDGDASLMLRLGAAAFIAAAKEVTMGLRNELSDGAVGTRLYRLRTYARLSQKQAGRLIGVSAPTYAKIELGRRSLKPREAGVFAAHYGVDERWITCNLSPKECEVVEVMRRPESAPTPQISVPSASFARRIG